MTRLTKIWSFLTWRIAALAVIQVLPCSPVLAERAAVPNITDFKKLSIEELLNIDITSVSRTEEELRTAAAAVTVVTNEDIRRSGAQTIPEALRMVPGVFVGQINSNSWAVGSRGFSGVNSEKLLVLSDGRSIYTPLFSGVFWDVQNYLMEDIDRIEVIRGPGASLWGSNAVNGVINITTKDARDTQGLYFEGGAGTEDRVVSAARYGGKVGEDIYYRVFARSFDRDDTFHSDPTKSDDWDMSHVGFRTEWYASEKDTLTIQGEGYFGNVGQLSPAANVIGRPGPEGDLDVDVSGGNFLTRWQHQIQSDSDLELKAYYDRADRNDPTFNDNLDTLDLDLQHSFKLTPRQHLTWGTNYRYTLNHNEGKEIFALVPRTSRDNLYSAFLQDQLTVLENLQVTVGTKVEHNDFSGFELQPSARAALELSKEHTLWSAISRAVRVPTRLERDVAIDLADPISNPLPRLIGNSDFDSEELIAYEAGHRWQMHESVNLDLAVFYNDYDKLSSLEIDEPSVEPDGQVIIPIVNQNLSGGRGYGGEALLTYSPCSYWRLTGMYSHLDLSLNSKGDDLNRGEFLEGATPRHQIGVQSSLDLPGGFEIDLLYRKIGDVRSIPEIVSGEGLDGYNEMDLRVGWRANKEWEFSVIGRNLLADHHPEFGDPVNSGEIERSIFGRVVYRY